MKVNDCVTVGFEVNIETLWGRAIDQAVNPSLPTAAARVETRV
jgi:hypothetical protein